MTTSFDMMLALLLGAIDPDTNELTPEDHLLRDPAFHQTLKALATGRPLTEAQRSAVVAVAVGDDPRTGEPIASGDPLTRQHLIQALMALLAAQAPIRPAQTAPVPAQAVPVARPAAVTAQVLSPLLIPSGTRPTSFSERGGQEWTVDEDWLLLDLYIVQQADDETVATRLGRTKKAVARRLCWLQMPECEKQEHYARLAAHAAEKKAAKLAQKKADLAAVPTAAPAEQTATMQAAKPLVQNQVKLARSGTSFTASDYLGLLRCWNEKIDYAQQETELGRTEAALRWKISQLGLSSRGNPWTYVPPGVHAILVKAWLDAGTGASQEALQAITASVRCAFEAALASTQVAA